MLRITDFCQGCGKQIFTSEGCVQRGKELSRRAWHPDCFKKRIFLSRRQEAIMKKFQRKWTGPGTRFLKPMCHVDDVRELVEKIINQKGL